MSYTNERDEIADPFGVLPSPRDKGYSEEFDHPDLATHAPQALSAPSAAEAPAPLPLPEIKKPVKLRPPAHVEPHPHDTPPPRRLETIRTVPQASSVYRPLPAARCPLLSPAPAARGRAPPVARR